MSASTFSSDDGFYGSNTPPKKPPKILFYVGLFSVIFGTLVGAYGVFSAETASNSMQYLLGFSGYLLTALLPIVVLQVIVTSHKKDFANNQAIPYDDYSGLQMQKKFKKVVLTGLISAALSIWVFFLPIAERFAA